MPGEWLYSRGGMLGQGHCQPTGVLVKLSSSSCRNILDVNVALATGLDAALLGKEHLLTLSV